LQIHLLGVPSGLIGDAGSVNALAVDQDAVYWGNNTYLQSYARANGSVRELAASGQLSVDIALDDTRIYWILAADSIAYIPKACAQCTPRLMGHRGTPHAIAVDQHAIYRTNQVSDSPYVGEVVKIAKPVQ
jgi:hypothetical protein